MTSPLRAATPSSGPVATGAAAEAPASGTDEARAAHGRHRIREHVASIKQAPKTAKVVASSIRKMSTTTDRKALVDAFVSGMQPLVGYLDRRGDAFSVGYSGEVTALAGGLKGSEFLYIRGRDGVPARLVVNRSRGAGGRPFVGFASHIYTRVYYGTPERIRQAGVRRIVDLGAGVGMAGVSKAGFTANTPDGVGVAGSATSLNLFFGPGLPGFNESAVAVMHERAERSIDLTPEEVQVIESALARAPDAHRTRALVDRAAKNGPVPALIVGANQLAKGSIVFATEGRRGFPFLGLKTGSWAARAVLPVTLGIDLVSVGTAAAADLRAGDESFGRTRQAAGRAVGGTVGAIGGALLALAVGHMFFGGVNQVVKSAGWVASHLPSPAGLAKTLRAGLPDGLKHSVVKAGTVIGSAFGALLGEGAGRFLAASSSAPTLDRGGLASDDGEKLVDHPQRQAPDPA